MTVDRIYGNSIAPKSFHDGLSFWRSNLFDKTSAKIDTWSNAKVVNNPDDAFGTLVIQKSSGKIQIVHHNPIPILIGQYLEVRTKIAIKSGTAVSAKIVAVPITSSGTVVVGAPSEGPTIALNQNGAATVTAVFGSGNRPGVDMDWGLDFESCYIGIEINGSGSSEVHIERIEINDATGHFLSTNSDWVDIRDFGAVGNGSHDCRAAIVAADKEAKGRAIFIPKGDYFVGDDITILSPVRAYGRLVCAEDTAVMLADNYNLHRYVHVFKDEYFAFTKALQALFRFTDHETLDLCGRKITLSGPIDLQKLVKVTTRNVSPLRIHNGQLSARSSSAWASDFVTSKASWSRDDANKLTNVANIDQIQMGSLVQGTGVGREVYVMSVDKTAKTLVLSAEISKAASSQDYTFVRFKFMIDCSGFTNLGRFEMSDMVFACGNRCSVWMLAQFGRDCRLANSWISDPKDRAICSFNEGCGSFSVDRCLFNSAEANESAKDRTSIAISTRKHDVKIRDNVATYFRHFAFLDGSGHVISGNHFFQGNRNGTPDRSAGVVLTYKRAKTLIVGNYIDNSWVELTDEQSVYWTDKSSMSFGNLTVTGNIFTANSVGKEFSWIKLRPNGNNCYVDGILVTSNTFYVTGNYEVNRVESVIDDNGTLDMSRSKILRFENNAFKNVENRTICPITREIKQSTAKTTWSVNFSDAMPFGGQVLRAESVVGMSDLSKNEQPLATLAYGTGGQSLGLKFSGATSGSVIVKVGADLPD